MKTKTEQSGSKEESERARQLKRDLVNALRRNRASYQEAIYWFRQARKEVGLERGPENRQKLPRVLTQGQVDDFFAAVHRSGNLAHKIAFELLATTGLRCAELCAIRREDVDLERCQIHVVQGKGAKDRRVPFPDALRLALEGYMAATGEQTHLFESRLKRPWTTRWLNKLCHDYGAEAGVPDLHPHEWRHHTLTYLTKERLNTAQLRLISGHASQKSLEVYQHLSLSDVEDDYQEAMARRPRGKR
jgi:integrase